MGGFLGLSDTEAIIAGGAIVVIVLIVVAVIAVSVVMACKPNAADEDEEEQGEELVSRVVMSSLAMRRKPSHVEHSGRLGDDDSYNRILDAPLSANDI